MSRLRAHTPPDLVVFDVDGCLTLQGRAIPGAREALAEKLAPLAPRLAEIGIARGWACLRTFAPDRRPVIGWDADAPGLFWVAGLGGHGATGSAAVGARAAALVLERVG